MLILNVLSTQRTVFYREPLQESLNSLKITAWCVINLKTLVEPYWFNNGEGKAITVK